MERQLANLTGLVQKALTQNVPTGSNVNQNYLAVPGQYRGNFCWIKSIFISFFNGCNYIRRMTGHFTGHFTGPNSFTPQIHRLAVPTSMVCSL